VARRGLVQGGSKQIHPRPTTQYMCPHTPRYVSSYVLPQGRELLLISFMREREREREREEREKREREEREKRESERERERETDRDRHRETET
jgi:hypothetical protein